MFLFSGDLDIIDNVELIQLKAYEERQVTKPPRLWACGLSILLIVRMIFYIACNALHLLGFNF